MQFTSPVTVLVILTLCGCPPPNAGDSPQDTVTATTTTGVTADATTTTTGIDLTTDDSTGTEVPTTTTEPVPGVCGDGVVNLGESCDDANDQPNDGCDGACQPSGAVVWTVETPGFLEDMALSPDGTIVLSGWTSAAFLVGLGPDGELLWQVQPADAGKLAIDADGQIYIASLHSGPRGLAPDGAQLWGSAPGDPTIFAPVIGIDVTDDGLYVGTYETESQDRVVMRRYDKATCEVVWETQTPADTQSHAYDLAAVGRNIFAVGRTTNDTKPRPMLAVFDDAGVLLSLELDDPYGRPWHAVAGIGDDDELVIAGHGAGDDGFVVRRLNAEHDEIWTIMTPEIPDVLPKIVATAPGERIAVLGSDAADNYAIHVRLFDAGGNQLWKSKLSSPDGAGWSDVVAAACGPDALVVAGSTWLEDENMDVLWVRRFALD